MCTWSCWLPRHRYSVFSLLALIPLSSIAFLQFSSHLSILSQVSPHSTTSSAKRMSHGASRCSGPVIQSITMANRSGLKAEPWWRPTSTSKSSVTPATVRILVRLPSYISWIRRITFSSTSFSRRQFHTSICGTWSYAFSRSMKTQCRFLWPSWYFSMSCLSANMASVVLLQGIKPNCWSDIVTVPLSPFSITLSHIFSECDISFIPL